MQLNISYADGSRRIINLTKDFFNKTPESELREKAALIAFDTGRPYNICLERDNKVVFNKTFDKNKPAVREIAIKMSEKTKARHIENLKRLKKETKNQLMKVIFPVKA